MKGEINGLPRAVVLDQGSLWHLHELHDLAFRPPSSELLVQLKVKEQASLRSQTKDLRHDMCNIPACLNIERSPLSGGCRGPRVDRVVHECVDRQRRNFLTAVASGGAARFASSNRLKSRVHSLPSSTAPSDDADGVGSGDGDEFIAIARSGLVVVLSAENAPPLGGIMTNDGTSHHHLAGVDCREID